MALSFTLFGLRVNGSTHRLGHVDRGGAVQLATRSTLSALCPCFRSLPDVALREFAEVGHFMDVPKGRVLFVEGEPARHAYVVRSGRVHLEHVLHTGSIMAVCVMGAGDLFCRLPLIDGGPYPATAVAACMARLYRLPTELLREQLNRCPTFARMILSRVAQCLRRVGCQSCHGDAGARIAFKLLTMCEQFGSDVPLTRRELGELAGTSVETAIRQIKDFERRGWVRLKRGHVRIIDRAALRLRFEGGFTLVL